MFDVLQNNVCMEIPIASIRMIHHTNFPIISERKEKTNLSIIEVSTPSVILLRWSRSRVSRNFAEKKLLARGKSRTRAFFPAEKFPENPQISVGDFLRGASWEDIVRNPSTSLLFFFFFSPLTREVLRRRRNQRKNNYERENTVDETKLRLFRIYERSKSNWYRSIERCPLFINPLVIPALLNGASSPTGPRARVIWIRCPVSPLLCVNCIIFTPNTFRP